MDSDLLSGDDDSLLSMQVSPIVSNASPFLFSCSPLLRRIPRSTSSSNPAPPPPNSTEIINDVKDTCKPTSSLCEDIKDKENVNANKPEAPKLSIEPQQMKKKKKGFNLRKSLAWDRAFFTEEGVLDPSELSMLSGNTLCAIHEGRESLSSELDGPSASPSMRTLKHNSFKESPSSARNGGSKVAGKMSPKLAYSPKDKASPQNTKGMKFTCPQAKRKILSPHDINKSSSKRSGCPRSLASSFLKKTSNIKVTVNEPRVSKQLDTRNKPLVVSTTSRSSVTSASQTKRNFSSQPATGQKNIGIKGISSSAKSCRNDAKSGPCGKAVKKSTTQPARSMLKVSAKQEIHSSPNLQLPKDSIANNSSGGLSDAVFSAAAHPLNGHDSTSRQLAVSLPQTSCFYGGNTQHAQTQIPKPSGLRMPSPSLGFFGQSKPSNSHSESQRGPQSCNVPEATIPSVSKAGGLNSIHRRPPRPSSKITKFSVKSDQELPDADIKSSDDGNPCKKVEKLSCIEDIRLQNNKVKLPTQSGPCEQLKKDDGKSAVDVCPRSRGPTVASLNLPHCLSPIQLFLEVEKQQVGDRKPGTCRVGPISEMQSQRLNETLMEDCRSSKKDVKDYILNASDNVLEVQVCRTVSSCPTHSTEAEPTKDATSGTDCLNEGSYVGEVQMLSVESTPLTGSCNSLTNTSAEDSNWMILDSPGAESTEQTEILSSCFITEQISQNNCESPSKSCLEYGNCSEEGPSETNDTLAKEQVEDRQCKPSIKCYTISPQSITENMNHNPDKTGSEAHVEQLSGLGEFELSSQQAEVKKPVTCSIDPISPKGCLQHGKCSEESLEKNNLLSVKGAESRASDVPCSMASVNEDLNFVPSGKVEYRHLENAFTSFVDNESLVGNFSHNVELCGEASASASDTYYKRDIIGEVISNNVMEEKYCLNSGGDIGSKLENLDVVSQISCREVEVSCGMNNMSLHGVIDKQSDPSDENLFFSELQPEASYSPEKEIVVLHSDCSADMHDGREHGAEQVKLISSCSHEVDQENQNCQLCDDTLGDENGSFEDVSCIQGCRPEISHIPRKMDEVAGTDNTGKGTLNGDALAQFIDESSLADSSNCNIDNSMETKRSVLVGNDKSRQDPELQNLDVVIDKVHLENAGLCLDDNLLLINTSIECQVKDTVKKVPSELESFVVEVNADRVVEYQSTRPSCDNIECYKDCDDNNSHEHDYQSCPSNLGSSSNSDGYQISSVANYESNSRTLNEKTNDTSSGSIDEDVREPYNTILPLETEINIHKSNGSFDSEPIDGLCSDAHPEAVKDAALSLNNSVEEKKQDKHTIEPPPDAIPFSDEWLAALEAAGEEILARKGGAVQNSPTDKSSPERNPWSPVKRKNNQGLGPFDCTKFINPTDPSSASN